ncbi:hypothetical protein V6Z12_A03G157200 [Gossypium hirsutum]
MERMPLRGTSHIVTVYNSLSLEKGITPAQNEAANLLISCQPGQKNNLLDTNTQEPRQMVIEKVFILVDCIALQTWLRC